VTQQFVVRAPDFYLGVDPAHLDRLGNPQFQIRHGGESYGTCGVSRIPNHVQVLERSLNCGGPAMRAQIDAALR
jgi:hypothetical protein